MNFQSVYCFDGLTGREPAGWRVEGGGGGLGEDQMLVVQQDSGEVVDWPNGTE